MAWLSTEIRNWINQYRTTTITKLGAKSQHQRIRGRQCCETHCLLGPGSSKFKQRLQQIMKAPAVLDTQAILDEMK